MKSLKSILIFSTSIFGVSAAADFLTDIRSLGDSLISHECDLKNQVSHSQSPSQLWNQLKGKNVSYFGACGTARDLYYIVQNSSGEMKQRAWVKMVNVLRVAGDHVEALNQSNLLIKHHPHSSHVHDVRWNILEVVYEQMNKSKGRDPSWAERIIGEHPRSDKAFYQNFIARNFVRDFPESKMRKKAIKMELEAKAFLSLHDLDIGKRYYSQKKFKAAIVRLSRVYQRGSQAQGYAEAVQYMISAFKGYKEQILNAAQGNSGGFFSRGPSPQELASQLGYSSFNKVPLREVVAELDAQIAHLEGEV